MGFPSFLDDAEIYTVYDKKESVISASKTSWSKFLD